MARLRSESKSNSYPNSRDGKGKDNLIRFLRSAFSECGRPSSKRIVGGLIAVAVCFCTVYITIRQGMSPELRSVIEVEIISACALLGVSSITSIWKK